MADAGSTPPQPDNHEYKHRQGNKRQNGGNRDWGGQRTAAATGLHQDIASNQRKKQNGGEAGQPKRTAEKAAALWCRRTGSVTRWLGKITIGRRWPREWLMQRTVLWRR